MSSYEIGEIYAVLTLIDFGRTSALCDRHSNQSSISCFPQVKNFVNFFSFILHKVGLDKSWMLKKWQLEILAIYTVIYRINVILIIMSLISVKTITNTSVVIFIKFKEKSL